MQDDDVALAIANGLRGRSVACAESCTAGRLSAVFASVAGSADWFRGGVVAYQVPVKRSLLGVQARSVFTEQAASEMALGAARLLAADIAVAVTGVAGEEPQDGVPGGTVMIATYVEGFTRSHTYRFSGDAEEICDRARRAALDILLNSMRDHDAVDHPRSA